MKNIGDFLDSKKIIIEDEIVQLTNNFNFNEFKKILIKAISELEPVIVSRKLTCDKIEKFLQPYKRHTPDYYGEVFTNEYGLISKWLLYYTQEVEIFYYSRESLKQIFNSTYYGKGFPIQVTPITKEEEFAIDNYKKNYVNTKDKDYSKFDNLFIATINEKQIERFKKDIDTFIDSYTKNQIVALASVIYDILHKKTTKPKFFSAWLKTFCAIIGKTTPSAKQSKTEVQAEKSTMKSTYYYLFDKIP